MSSMLWPILGAVRFFLALIVAGAHLIRFFPDGPVVAELIRFSAIVAVFAFLIISGFSIAASYAKQPKGFYGRRALRILPLYFLAIVAGVVCTLPFGGTVPIADGGVFHPPGSGTVLQNIFFLQGFTSPSIGTNAAIWSLSLEVVFYVLTPLLARLSQTSLTLIAGFSLLLFVGALQVHLYPNFPVMLGGESFALLAWCWLAGFIAFRHRNHTEAALVILGVAIVALRAYKYALASTWYWPLPIVAVTLAMGLGHQFRGSRRLGVILTLFGDASYPLYLFHIPVFVMLTGLKLIWSELGYLGAAILVAIGLDRLYDRPLKRLLLHLHDILASRNARLKLKTATRV